MNSEEQKPIVRFAPSPTGHLHIGGARTALFNYLYAKSKNGIFILRIEDTDRDRSSKKMSEEIIQSLKWLGLNWDKGPYYQSVNILLHRKAAEKLLVEKKAYRCFCTPEELKKRQVVDGKTLSYMYDRHCLQLTKEEIDEKLENGTPYVVRFLVPEGITKFKDRIHKEVKTQNSEIEDFIILRSDNSATYQLSVVVDDLNMGVTDVIRGDDHISNTFKQIMLFKAMEGKIPKYTHLPLVFGNDKKKLSKRHGETSLLEFKKKGYLPEALITYFSQLSWNPGDTKKVYYLEELSKNFNFGKLSKNSPVFDYDKLLFLNSRAIRNLKPERITDILFEDKKVKEEFENVKIFRIFDLIELVKPRMKLINDFIHHFRIYLFGDFKYEQRELESLSLKKSIVEYLEAFILKLFKIDDFSSQNIETQLRNIAEELNIEAKILIHPSRFALTGMNVSPSVFDVYSFLGKEESVKRLKNFLNYLKKNVFTH